MKSYKRLFSNKSLDPRVNNSLISPKSTIITAGVIIVYSGVLLSIFKNISFNNDNSWFLTGAILGLIVVTSLCIACLTNYVHYVFLTQPVLTLADAARKVAGGDYSVKLYPHRNDGKINEMDALYEDFNNMVDVLNSTEMLKSSFISNISHELKTPIAVINNYSSIIATNNLSREEEIEYIEKIRSASSDLSTLITNILQISKLDNNQIETHPTSFDLCEEIIQSVLAFEMQLDEKEIELELNIPETYNIISDSGLLKIVINNLLSNAIKFSPSGKKISIGLTDASETVTVSVSDQGCGIPEESCKYIFDKFYQADASHTTKGNGLGLAMAKQIIHLLNGSIKVNSVVGEGSEFTITLPKGKTPETRGF